MVISFAVNCNAFTVMEPVALSDKLPRIEEAGMSTRSRGGKPHHLDGLFRELKCLQVGGPLLHSFM